MYMYDSVSPNTTAMTNNKIYISKYCNKVLISKLVFCPLEPNYSVCKRRSVIAA